MNEHAYTFRYVLKCNIRQYIADCKRLGDAVAMSIPNLCQCVKTPAHTLPGAPAGPEQYRAMFASICREDSVIKKFLIP